MKGCEFIFLPTPEMKFKPYNLKIKCLFHTYNDGINKFGDKTKKFVYELNRYAKWVFNIDDKNRFDLLFNYEGNLVISLIKEKFIEIYHLLLNLRKRILYSAVKDKYAISSINIFSYDLKKLISFFPWNLLKVRGYSASDCFFIFKSHFPNLNSIQKIIFEKQIPDSIVYVNE